MILKLSLDLPDDTDYIPLTRQFGRDLLEYLSVVAGDIGDVETIVTELATNVVRHASSANGRFHVQLEYHADRVIITVEDTGEGFCFRDLPEVGAPRLDSEGRQRIGGYGLPLVEYVADRVEFSRTDPHGTTVRAEKLLHYKSQAAADNADRMDESGGGQATMDTN